jgi:hypothetical protein
MIAQPCASLGAIGCGRRHRYALQGGCHANHRGAALAAERTFLLEVVAGALGQWFADVRREMMRELREEIRELKIEVAKLASANAELRIANAERSLPRGTVN